MTDKQHVAGTVLGPNGEPVKAKAPTCPGEFRGSECGAPKSEAIASSGFGVPEPTCRRCGYVWKGEAFRG